MVTNNEGQSQKIGYATLAIWIIFLGIFLIASPDWFYGESWSYFSRHHQFLLPAGGKGMGTCLVGIGTVQLVIVWRNMVRFLALLFFLSGFVFWVSGILLFAEGLLGHEGLSGAPFIMALGVHKFYVMANAANDYGVATPWPYIRAKFNRLYQSRPAAEPRKKDQN